MPSKSKGKTMETTDMYQRLEVFFYDETVPIHLLLNDTVLCGFNPDSARVDTFHSSIIGTSSMTLKEELSYYENLNSSANHTQKYCSACLDKFIWLLS